MGIFGFFKIILRGISQVMLQNNALTGALFLAGIFYNSWVMGVGALIGVFVSTFTAFVLKYKKQDIRDGLYGFNGTLAGIALFFFFKINIFLVSLVILSSIFSSIIMNFMHKRRLYPFTLPFVLITWVSILIAKFFNLASTQTSELVKETGLNVLPSLSMGLGQVMFQTSIITGIIFLIAILVNSRISAVYALIGSSMGVLVSFLLSFPLNLVNTGIFGFNGVLCAIAFADKRNASLIYALISAAISVFIIYGMISLSIISLTAPFVFAAWIVLALQKHI
ncbi:urea transporter [Candidatus Woesearchaeota archaeon CG10_big_fil_rev_8_21_14_0_10_44_13]|nr:MAG: urea transporter [Candidatus Woesearchaeota archaeon CG10_big_fil_rev_8_21_14_0_10_44_13]